MTLRTRDQADIVDAVVAFHLHAGVDYVIATDHRSEDGTAEILEEYARQGVVHVIREAGEEVRGSEWRTRMARMAAAEYGADWTFSADGDEFWWPRGPSLKAVLEAIPERLGVVYALVRPFVPVQEGTGFFAERMTVRLSPLAAINNPGSPFRPYRKVAHRADPTVVVERGNHALLETRHPVLANWYPIEVLHFPIRSAQQAERKYLTWSQVLPDSLVGTRRKVVQLARENRLDEHFETYALDAEDVRRGVDEGVLVTDTRLRDFLRSLPRETADTMRFAVPSKVVEPVTLPAPPVEDGPGFPRECVSSTEAAVVRIRRSLDRLERRLQAAERRPRL